MPTTLADIARELGVSKMTVSRAINNHPEISPETRARILEAAQRMNYRPNQFARALTTNRSYLLGVVVPDLMHSYFAEICRGVEGLARPLGYQNLICSTDEQSANEQHEVEVLLPRTDGLIIASSVPPDENVFYRRIIKDGAKIILIDRRLEGVRCPTVTTDDLKVGSLATEHLINLGHRQVGHLLGTVASTAALRFEGYKQALAKYRIAFDSSLVRECGFTEREGYESMSGWLNEGNAPSAIFAEAEVPSEPARDRRRKLRSGPHTSNSVRRPQRNAKTPGHRRRREYSLRRYAQGPTDHGRMVHVGDGAGGSTDLDRNGRRKKEA